MVEMPHFIWRQFHASEKNLVFSPIFGMQHLNYAVELHIDSKGIMKETRLSSLVTWLHAKTAYFSVILL